MKPFASQYGTPGHDFELAKLAKTECPTCVVHAAAVCPAVAGDWNEGCFWFDPSTGSRNYLIVWPELDFLKPPKWTLAYNVVQFA